mmetsp:Transcript_27389/g.38718  ORF Transcript_27389/g.38718 Transcript_27389/m.38718 type:complete len:148 (+) Transcript_27389:242-685(+)
MMFVDTWLVYKGATGTKELQKHFYTMLSEELIDNCFYNNDEDGLMKRRSNRDTTMQNSMASRSGAQRGRCGVDMHLTPTKRMRKSKEGTDTKQCYQGRCKVNGCRAKTKYMCSTCNDDKTSDDKEVFICHSDTGRLCFTEHMKSHSI